MNGLRRGIGEWVGVVRSGRMLKAEEKSQQVQQLQVVLLGQLMLAIRELMMRQ